MSKFLLREFYQLCEGGICQDFLTEAEKMRVKNGALILTGKMQEAGVKNGNGRIYSKPVLMREVENYMKVVRERRALGECVEEGTKILTLNGWKDFRDVKVGEYAYTLNSETQEIEFQRITAVIDKSYKGKMLRFKNRQIDIALTPKHRLLLVNQNGKTIETTAQEIYENRNKYDKCYIPKRGVWNPPEQDKDFFELKGINNFDKRTKKVLVEKYSKSLKIDLNAWTSFMGLYLSEGSAPKKHGYMITITQNEGPNAEDIRKLLAKFPSEIEWTENKHFRKNGKIKITFRTADARLYDYLSPLGKSHEKFIPKELKLLSPNYLSNILEWYILGDGRTRECENAVNPMIEVFSTSQRLIEDLHEILLKTGQSGNIQQRQPYDRMIEGRLIKKENQRILHILHFSTTNGIYLTKRHCNIKEEQYDGKVYCVTIPPHHSFYCQMNGKSFWSLNCDHPDDSVVNLKNASHIVTDLWWDNNALMGKIEVLPTPSGKILRSLIESGVQLGISSRGLGSVDETAQGTIVQEDFQLICFDMVSEPSTPSAYMTPLREGQEKRLLNNLTKADKINRALNDILLKNGKV